MTKTICMLTIGDAIKDDRIFYKECKSLLNAGFEVHILALVEKDGFARDMQGNILNSKAEDHFELEGIKVHVIRKTESFSNKISQKILSTDFHKAFVKKGIELGAEIYHAHEPDSYLLGLKIQERVKDSKLVLDAHESWGKRGVKAAFAKYFKLDSLKYLISANSITRGYLLTLNFKIKTETIYNTSLFSHKNTLTFDEEKFKILHEGTLKFNRGLKNICALAKGLKGKNFNFQIDLAGYIPDEESKYLNDYIKINKLENEINILGNIQYEELSNTIRDYHLGLILSTQEENNYLAGPANKFFNYAAANIPILCNDLPETSRLVRKFNIGKVNPSDDSLTIIENTSFLIENRHELKVYSGNLSKHKDHFTWKNEAEKLIDFYKTYLS